MPLGRCATGALCHRGAVAPGHYATGAPYQRALCHWGAVLPGRCATGAPWLRGTMPPGRQAALSGPWILDPKSDTSWRGACAGLSGEVLKRAAWGRCFTSLQKASVLKRLAWHFLDFYLSCAAAARRNKEK